MWNSGEVSAIFSVAMPEIILVLAGLIGVLSGAIWKDKFNESSFWFASLALLVAALVAFFNPGLGEAFTGCEMPTGANLQNCAARNEFFLVQNNGFVNFARVVTYLLAASVLIISTGFLKRHGTLKFEYPLLVLFASFGMGIMLSAADLMTLYLGIETLSLSSYVLAAFHRNSARSSEAGLKYFVLGALASGILLYGASLVYGFSGSTQYGEIAEFASEGRNIGFLFGMILMITGLAFKVSAAPMHVWTPDVYEGAPTPVVAFFAAAPKIAGMAVFANILFSAFGPAIGDWQGILAIIAGSSMLIGAFGALGQTNIKRLLAYSSIANVGYALVAVTAGPKLGAGAILVFMTLYVIGALGLFAGVMLMRRKGGMVEDISELSGLIKSQPWITAMLTILVFSVAGLPPFGGFWGKVQVVMAGMSGEHYILVGILIVSSVVSLGYYLRIIQVMWFNDPSERFEKTGTSISVLITISALLSGVVFMFFIGQLVGGAEVSSVSVYSDYLGSAP